MVADVTDETVKTYQADRLKDKAAPKSINDEVGFLLRVLGEQGDFLRIKLRRSRSLKLSSRHQVARAYTSEEKAMLLTGAKARRSRTIYPALMLALHAGMRDAEMRGLQWGRVDLRKAIVTVGDSKTEAGQGRTIPLNGDVLAALEEYFRGIWKSSANLAPNGTCFRLANRSQRIRPGPLRHSKLSGRP